VFAFVFVFALVCAGCGWTKFGYDATNSRFNASASGINASNVGSLVLKGTAATGKAIESSPALATVNGKFTAFVASDSGELYAFDATGKTGCSGTPTTCNPLWSATISLMVINKSSPAVANGVVYIGSANGSLYAFDAAGNTNCSGTPKTCNPLWTATTGGAVQSSPTIVNGVVYVGSSDTKLYAFDATGTTGCSGTPKTCNPLWTGATGAGIDQSTPAVANGVVYIGSFDNNLYAFDATGTTGCSGTPKTCNPLLTGTTGNSVASSPAVTSYAVYVGSYDGNLYGWGLP
jgi:outer membrane protein assembly factor BamB